MTYYTRKKLDAIAEEIRKIPKENLPPAMRRYPKHSDWTLIQWDMRRCLSQIRRSVRPESTGRAGEGVNAMTNAERAGAAQVALGWHAVEKDGEKPDWAIPGVLEEEMIDLLADLEHLALRENINFADIKERALRHVFEERAGR